MAFSTKLIGVPRDGGTPTWDAEVPWWQGRMLMKDSRFREVSMNDGYLDYVALLTPREAKSLNDQFSKGAVPTHERDIEEIDEILSDEDPKKTFLVAVIVYEWESGLG